MKRLAVGLSTMLLGSLAWAGLILPQGYVEQPVKAPGTKMFVNPQQKSFIAVTLMHKSDTDDALSVLKKISEPMTCEGEIKGTKVISSISKCKINDVEVDFGVIVTKDKMSIFQTSSNVKDEDFQTFLANFLPGKEQQPKEQDELSKAVEEALGDAIK